jgi:2'-5' RNA ligase
MEIRSFIAVETTEEMVARLTALQGTLRGAGADVGWTAPAGIHVTLRFLGDVAEERISVLAQALEVVAARHAPFAVQLAGVGAFPSARQPRIMWVGITEGAEPLRALAAGVEAAMVAAGFPREERAFRAHLTLGRVRSPHGVEQLVRLLAAQAAEEYGTMPVAAISYMRSDLTPQGARYTTLYRLPLTGGGYAA